MNSSTSSSPCLLFIFITIFFNSAKATRIIDTPRLSPNGGRILRELAGIVLKRPSEDFNTFYYNQTLDHFNYKPESYSTFRQKYVVNFKNWGGANASAPIFAYFGAEAPLNEEYVAGIGFMTDNAVRFKALLVYVEHRYYGESIPFGSREEAFQNASSLGYFNSAQAIADYAEILLHVKTQYQAQDSPVIVVGGSYGGMLASWFRLKYPHIAIGALASSSPILYFDNITPHDGYYSIVTKDFREASETCYQTIRDSWSEIDRVASEPDGLSTLSKKFRTCNPLTKSSQLKNSLRQVYASAAQYNRPPRYPVTVVCGAIDGEGGGGDILSKIFAGVVAYYRGNSSSCYVNAPPVFSETIDGWNWQRCSEMVIPIGIENNTMFQPNPFVLSEFINDCTANYGVSPRPHWVSTYYGGYDIKLILRRFGSNIIFSNGLKDPYSSGGVLENISKSIVAVKTMNGKNIFSHGKNLKNTKTKGGEVIIDNIAGSHCLDMGGANSSDPDWLVDQIKIEVQIIEGWIANYYSDLNALNT